ncbi:acyl-CoA synthetase [Rhodococcus spelaei]|uniref:Acyl-CoA synthetase n=1 Tax=Rhodococcus spelaei TaxID=2546320 RepID=A0A541BQF2_9NOCA|nr:acyl-CoA synthetase [Rhodococcus spelaei]TQF74551.1 acyl-CoA synthetase [Rhodococcus spelaei]
MSLNLADLFEAAADAVPDRAAIVCGTQRRTFAELDERSNQLAHYLADAGVGPGDHVGMYMRNSTEFVEALLACLKIRAVPVNINYRYVDAELTYLFTNAELVAVIADGEFVPTVAAVLPDAPKVGLVVTVGPAAEADWGSVTAVDFQSAADSGSAVRDFPERSNDDLFIIYTGGTTGMPKGVMWRQEDFFHAALTGGNPFGDPYSSAAEMAAAVPHIPPMTWMLTAPLIHGAALYSLFTAFMVGATHVLMPKFDAADCLALIERERVMTMTVVGDAMARPLADAIDADGGDYDLSSLLVVGSGGALFSKSVRDQLTAALPNLIVRDGFGASESGVDGNLEIGADGLLRIAAKPTVRVVDERMRPLEPGSDEVGYIARSGNVPIGYWGDPEKSAATFPVIDGVRMSILGDVARVDADGSIVLLGRGSMCINSGGEKVYPEEVEMAIKSHPAVMDALVAGVEDARYGQKVGAVVQAREGFEVPDLDELLEHCRTQIAGYKVPRVLVGVGEIRRSPAGKADYRWARATLEGESAGRG